MHHAPREETMASFAEAEETDSPRPKLELPGLPGVGLGLKSLSVKVVRVPFVQKVFEPGSCLDQWKASVSSRMRTLDDVHKHAPLEEECGELNIPNDRLDLHRMQDMLFLCGGCCGVRFSSEEMLHLGNLRAELQPAWDALDGHFQSMDSSLKKKVLEGGPYAPGAPLGNADAGLEFVVKFHQLADAYLAIMDRVQTLVKVKQGSIRREGESIAMPKFDKDPDGNVGKAMPDWLSQLLLKYQMAQKPMVGHTTAAAPSTSSLKAGATVGKLSVFLGACVVGAVTCTDEEWSAVSQLLHASNDSSTVFTIDGRMLERAPDGMGDGARPQPKPQRYWASRFFSFLSALTELKSLPRDEKAIATAA